MSADMPIIPSLDINRPRSKNNRVAGHNWDHRSANRAPRLQAVMLRLRSDEHSAYTSRAEAMGLTLSAWAREMVETIGDNAESLDAICRAFHNPDAPKGFHRRAGNGSEMRLTDKVQINLPGATARWIEATARAGRWTAGMAYRAIFRRAYAEEWPRPHRNDAIHRVEVPSFIVAKLEAATGTVVTDDLLRSFARLAFFKALAKSSDHNYHPVVYKLRQVCFEWTVAFYGVAGDEDAPVKPKAAMRVFRLDDIPEATAHEMELSRRIRDLGVPREIVLGIMTMGEMIELLATRKAATHD